MPTPIPGVFQSLSTCSMYESNPARRLVISVPGVESAAAKNGRQRLMARAERERCIMVCSLCDGRAYGYKNGDRLLNARMLKAKSAGIKRTPNASRGSHTCLI